MTLQRGFTLLEMMVVMVLMGLLTTLALPAMQRWHDAVQDKSQAAEIIDALRAAGFSAAANRRDIAVDLTSFRPAAKLPPATDDAKTKGEGRSNAETATPALPAGAASAAPLDPARQTVDSSQPLTLTLPNGWQADQVDQIRFLANGLCQPGSIVLRSQRGAAVQIDVHGPLCGVELAQNKGAASQ